MSAALIGAACGMSIRNGRNRLWSGRMRAPHFARAGLARAQAAVSVTIFLGYRQIREKPIV
jgi:hypothetical protein